MVVVAAPSVERGQLREEDLDGERWHARSGAAVALGVGWFAIHIGLAFVAAWAVGRRLGQPVGWGESIGWFLLLCTVATASVHLTQEIGRRLIPLRTLLRLSLAFPGAAPSRYAIALRAGNPRFLQRRVRDANENGITNEPDAAAIALLELVAALSRHDRSLRGHSERVRAYTDLLAEELGLDRGARDGLRWAGLMHDVGKLEIPSAILNKVEPLTSEEWALIRTHPTIGARLCAPLEPWLGEWTSAVLDHHERWDGHGYPRQLASTDISLAGRVVAVADAFDVMTSARSYKRPRAAEDALVELTRCAGTQFDPNVVRAFLGISVRRLRAVMGPAAVWAQRPFGWSWSRTVETIGGPIVAIVVASAVGLLSPVLSTPGGEGGHASATPAPAVAGGNPSTVNRAAATLSPTDAAPAFSGSEAGVMREPGGSAMSGPPSAPTRTPASISDPVPGAGPPPEGGGGTAASDSNGDPAPPAQPPASSDDIALTIDPGVGSVTVEGVGPAPDTGTTVVVPGTGNVTCGVAGVCEPVTVTIPVGGR